MFDFNRSSELSKRYSNLFKNPIDPRAYPEHLRIITVRGEIVRSWQECTIANLFYYENIDYEYEPKIWISNIPLISDFRLKSEYEKEIIWEHLGMDKNHYEDRLRLYEQSGFNIIEIKDIDEKILKEILNSSDRILIISYTDDVKDTMNLCNKIKLLKNCFHLKNIY